MLITLAKLNLGKRSGNTYSLGELASLLWRVEDLVVEDGEVEGEAQPDGVGGLHLTFADLEGVLVGLLRVVNNS